MSRQTVLISGAGIAGPTLAYWLKRAGFAPTLLDHAPALRSGGYVIDFWGLGYDIAERMGLMPDDPARGLSHPRDAHRQCGRQTHLRLRHQGLRRTHRRPLRDHRPQRAIAAAVRDAQGQHGDDLRRRDRRPGRAAGPCRRAIEIRRRAAVRSRRRRRRPAFGGAPRRLRAAGGFEKRLGYVVAVFEASGYRPRNEDVYVTYASPAAWSDACRCATTRH